MTSWCSTVRGLFDSLLFLILLLCRTENRSSPTNCLLSCLLGYRSLMNASRGGRYKTRLAACACCRCRSSASVRRASRTDCVTPRSTTATARRVASTQRASLTGQHCSTTVTASQVRPWTMWSYLIERLSLPAMWSYLTVRLSLPARWDHGPCGPTLPARWDHGPCGPTWQNDCHCQPGETMDHVVLHCQPGETMDHVVLHCQPGETMDHVVLLDSTTVTASQVRRRMDHGPCGPTWQYDCHCQPGETMDHVVLLDSTTVTASQVRRYTDHGPCGPTWQYDCHCQPGEASYGPWTMWSSLTEWLSLPARWDVVVLLKSWWSTHWQTIREVMQAGIFPSRHHFEHWP